MFVPVVVPSQPVSRRHSPMPTIVNKTIIYQDTVLDLKDKGANLSVTKIKVDIGSFEKCLNIIFESNPDVVFNTVQYSHQNKEAIFYTNKKISTEKWEKRNERTYRPVQEVSSILEAVEEVLRGEDYLDPECISAYDVWLIYNTIRVNEDRLKERIKNRIESKLKAANEGEYICFHGFDYNQDEVHIAIHKSVYKHVYFRKNGGDLYIYKQDGLITFNVLSLIGADIEEYYDYCYAQKEVWKVPAYNVRSINSAFYCDFCKPSVQIDENGFLWREKFKIGAYSHSKKFACECNSNNVLKLVNGREDEFAKKVFVRISDCPKWMQQQLRETRKLQVEQIQRERIAKEQEEKRREEEERRIKEEIERKLAKKQKRREFWKKVIPFIK